MARGRGYLALALGLAAFGARAVLTRFGGGRVLGAPAGPIADVLTILAVLLSAYGAYKLVQQGLRERTESKQRQQTQRTVLRIVFGSLALLGTFGVLTKQWPSVLVSLGIVGFAVTFALQQPLFSLIAWLYITVKEPFQAGDRIAIGETRGDVVSIDLLVTKLWEIDGDLVSTQQPSGRIVTIPNSVVLSREVTNYHGEGVAFVWNELSIQVAYETDLDFAQDTMIEIADELVGDDMAARVAEYRDRLEETPVDLEVQDRPTVNVLQAESWLELKLRYLVHPRRGTRVRNALYERILSAFNENPDRVKFPVSRHR